MKILAFGASNSKNSINQVFAEYAASLVPDAEIESLSIHDYEIPIFSMEREAELGQPVQAQAFLEKISNTDAVIVSFAEHNGNLTAAYKNLFDWASRIDTKVYQGKPAIFLSTSPGKGGGRNVLKLATDSAPYFGADLQGSYSLPDFYSNFDTEKVQASNPDTQNTLAKLVGGLLEISEPV